MADDGMRDVGNGRDVTPRGFLAHVGEARVDVAYWSTPLPMRVYMRVMYAVCGALCVAMALDGMGVPGVAQWTIGTLVFAYALTFRWFHPNGFQNVYDDIADGTEQGLRELREGNYDGVPLLFVPDEDYDRVREERRGRRVAAGGAAGGNGMTEHKD
jgi:hypothetical protein